MAEQSIRLIYPPSLVNVPVIHQLIRRFDVTVNILKAEISAEHGWLEIQITGSPALIDEAFAWLKSQGIDIQVLDS